MIGGGENDLHMAVASALRYSRALWWHTPNEGKRAVKMNPRTGRYYCPEGQKLNRMGMKKGAPDFFILKGGVLHGLEVKDKGKKPSGDQRDFGKGMVEEGGKWDWTDNLDTALDILRRWGVI